VNRALICLTMSKKQNVRKQWLNRKQRVYDPPEVGVSAVGQFEVGSVWGALLSAPPPGGEGSVAEPRPPIGSSLFSTSECILSSELTTAVRFTVDRPIHGRFRPLYIS